MSQVWQKQKAADFKRMTAMTTDPDGPQCDVWQLQNPNALVSMTASSNDPEVIHVWQNHQEASGMRFTEMLSEPQERSGVCIARALHCQKVYEESQGKAKGKAYTQDSQGKGEVEGDADGIPEDYYPYIDDYRGKGQSTGDADSDGMDKGKGKSKGIHFVSRWELDQGKGNGKGVPLFMDRTEGTYGRCGPHG